MNFTILHAFPPANLEEGWRDALTRVEMPSHYNAPEFFLEPFWTGKRPFAVLALEGGAVAGVLTGLHEHGEVSCGLPSRPQICVDRTQDAEAALHALARGLMEEAHGAELITVYSWAPLDAFRQYRFRARVLRGDVIIDLAAGPEALFKQISPAKRNKIRYATRHGVEVVPASTPEDIVAAYEVYDRWRNTARKKIEKEDVSFSEFERMCQLESSWRLFMARHSGKVVACSAFRFFPRGLVEYARNFSLDEFLKLKPNDLLQWSAIQWACAEGFMRYSLGGNGLFHRELGGAIVPIYRYRLDQTFLRQHDFKEAVRDRGREVVTKMPPVVEKAIRRALRRLPQKGW